MDSSISSSVKSYTFTATWTGICYIHGAWSNQAAACPQCPRYPVSLWCSQLPVYDRPPPVCPGSGWAAHFGVCGICGQTVLVDSAGLMYVHPYKKVA
jgi:hypothetical protein